MEYYTPQGKIVFPCGTAGLTNANVLHMARLAPGTSNNIHWVHLFDASLISGEKGSLIEQKYVKPITSDAKIEVIALFPEDEKQIRLLKLIRESFLLDDKAFGYELRLREMLTEIWLGILEVVANRTQTGTISSKENNQIKQMLLFIQEHYVEKLSIAQVANAAFLSERACYRLFQEYLSMTPTDYIKSYRLQMACQMLSSTDCPLAEIGQACGLGSSSYFGKVFREEIGCTPLQYRRNHWNKEENYEESD